MSKTVTVAQYCYAFFLKDFPKDFITKTPSKSDEI